MNTSTISAKVISSLKNIDYWKSLNPELSITERPYLRRRQKLCTNNLDGDRYVKQMQEEGYIKLDSVLPESHMERMALAITNIVKQGIPPAFVYIYDEFWQIFRDIAPVMTPIFGENYRLSTNRWAWYIPASDEYSGFAPHRDMVGCPEPVMRPDGLPSIATVWIPLKDVSAANACMHVLPINQDPNSPDNLTSTSIPQDRIQNIRALPCKAGSILSWNPNVLHWGSRSSKWSQEPRISIATYLIRANGPSFTSVGIEDTQPLTFDFRVGVISRILSHYDRDDISPTQYPDELLRFCNRYKFVEPNEWRFKQPGLTELHSSNAKSHSHTGKVGRNQPCPCGSGKKYKHCHGK